MGVAKEPSGLGPGILTHQVEVLLKNLEACPRSLVVRMRSLVAWPWRLEA